MTQAYFTKLFEYEAWANQTWLGALIKPLVEQLPWIDYLAYLRTF